MNDSANPVTSSNDPLLQPFQLKHLRLKNRVMSTSHAISYGEEGKPKARYQLYHEEKAKGGIALSMFGGSSTISPDSPSIFGQLDVGDDSVIPYFQEFSERLHKHGCALMCQLTHMGRRTSSYAGNWLPIIAPSRKREPLKRCFPREMDEHDIARVVNDYGEAALRCKEGGLDGLELIAGGHLIGQFLSPLANARTDKYGGSLENRMRFPLMVFEEVRRRTGEDYIVGIRTQMGEGEDGLTREDSRRVAEKLQAEGFVDFFNLNFGRMDTYWTLLEQNMPGMGFPIAPYVDRVKEFRDGLRLPVFHAARVTDVATARHAIKSGSVDMVGMTRAHIADPHIVRKIERGEEDRIRTCIGATYCMTPRRSCIQNPATGKEGSLPHQPSKAAAKLKVVVVGGGPAGLEAARVSAARGHEVVLFEAASELGGQLILASKVGWRRDMATIGKWLAVEVAKAGVDIRLNQYAGHEEVEAENPDAVIVATGGIPDFSDIEGGDLCQSSWDILSGEPIAQNVLVYDELGQNQAGGCADFIADSGAKVELVTRDNVYGFDLGWPDQTFQRKRFYDKNVSVTIDYQLRKVTRDGNQLLATFVNVLNGGVITRTVDQIVIERGTEPAGTLFEDLRAGSSNDGVVDLGALVKLGPQSVEVRAEGKYRLFAVGDAVQSRDVHAALLDSLRLCAAL